MAPFGPWDSERRVAVAVSGGADSLALALLAGGWGRPLALIVDHGLRPSSAAEAQQTRDVLAARGMPARILTLAGLRPGAGLQARARTARYAVLAAAAAQAGLVDLLLGHHAGDQAETVLMRQRRGSGPAGLAGMAAVTEEAQIRRVRPLLSVDPARLRATVRAAGAAWVEDPANADRAFTRTRLRDELGGRTGTLLAEAAASGRQRRADDATAAAALAAHASLFAEGYAVLAPGPVEPADLARLLHMVSGRPFPPAPGPVAALARALRPATLGGVRIMAAGRLGPGWLLVREEAAMAPSVPAAAGAVWDGRFRLAKAVPRATFGALGGDAVRVRRTGLPMAVLRTLPAVRRDDGTLGIPFVASRAQGGQTSERLIVPCAGPVCGAAFLAPAVSLA